MRTTTTVTDQMIVPGDIERTVKLIEEFEATRPKEYLFLTPNGQMVKTTKPRDILLWLMQNVPLNELML